MPFECISHTLFQETYEIFKIKFVRKKCIECIKNKKLNSSAYSHSIGHGVITHLWENLSFPVDAISDVETTSCDNLIMIQVTESNYAINCYSNPSRSIDRRSLTSRYRLNRSRRFAFSMASGNSARPPWGIRRLCPRRMRNCITSLRNSSFAKQEYKDEKLREKKASNENQNWTKAKKRDECPFYSHL